MGTAGLSVRSHAPLPNIMAAAKTSKCAIRFMKIVGGRA
jgi:hypothetical protein